MAKGKHRITKEKADILMAGMKSRISKPNSAFKDFPEGFIFDINDVRKLVGHPEAAHFIIRLGWKEAEGGLTPILCVADANKEVLEQGGQENFSVSTRGLTENSTEATGTSEEAGGYLDEASKYPG